MSTKRRNSNYNQIICGQLGYEMEMIRQRREVMARTHREYVAIHGKTWKGEGK
jgi:hypothetical protein